MKKSPIKRTPFKKKKESQKTLVKRWRKKAWDAQSKYVRLRDKKCVCCGSTNSLQAGHFYHGDNMDFVEENIHAQCAHCNLHWHGNGTDYSVYLVAKYGPDILSKLQYLKGQPRKYTVDELQEIYYKFSPLSGQKKRGGE